jgi:UDP-glucuronate decarboxylase
MLKATGAVASALIIRLLSRTRCPYKQQAAPPSKLARVVRLVFVIRVGSVKKILVSGGAGFLGSHLCDALLAAGHDVLCVDNFFTGRKQNVAHLFGNPRFELLRHDVTFPLYVEVDEIYNLACPASPVHYQFDPVQTTKTSVHGAINMLGLAKRVKARILQASTS